MVFLEFVTHRSLNLMIYQKLILIFLLRSVLLKIKKTREIFPSTFAADEHFEVRSETAYGSRNNEFTISGSGLICETTYLLVRKRHEFHGYKSEKYFVQRFGAYTKFTSFPLLYHAFVRD